MCLNHYSCKIAKIGWQIFIIVWLDCRSGQERGVECIAITLHIHLFVFLCDERVPEIAYENMTSELVYIFTSISNHLLSGILFLVCKPNLLLNADYCGFSFKKILENTGPFLWGHWYPCFGLLVTSALGFQAIVDPSLACFLACMQWMTQIHLWCDTCQSLDGQQGSCSCSLHAFSRGRMPRFKRETARTAIHSATQILWML